MEFKCCLFNAIEEWHNFVYENIDKRPTNPDQAFKQEKAGKKDPVKLTDDFETVGRALEEDKRHGLGLLEGLMDDAREREEKEHEHLTKRVPEILVKPDTFSEQGEVPWSIELRDEKINEISDKIELLTKVLQSKAHKGYRRNPNEIGASIEDLQHERDVLKQLNALDQKMMEIVKKKDELFKKLDAWGKNMEYHTTK